MARTNHTSTARTAGRILGLGPLASAGGPEPEALTRAGVLAAATLAAVTRSRDPQAALGGVLGDAGEHAVRQLARSLPGTGTERLKGALVLTYAVGALEPDRSSPTARAWARADRQFREAFPDGLPRRHTAASAPRPNPCPGCTGLGAVDVLTQAGVVDLIRAVWSTVDRNLVNISGINQTWPTRDTEVDPWGIGGPAGQTIYANDGVANAKLVKYIRTLRAMNDADPGPSGAWAQIANRNPQYDLALIWRFYAPVKFVAHDSLVRVFRDNEPRRKAGGALDPRAKGPHDTVFTSLAKDLDWLADELVADLLAGADAAGKLLCKVFTGIFGETVGGFLCTLVTALLRFAAGGIAGLVEAAAEVVAGLSEMLGLLVQGPAHFKEAATVFLRRVNTAVILAIGSPLAAAVNIPLTKAEAARRGMDPLSSLQGLGEKLSATEPMFVVNVAVAISALGLAPTPLSIGGVVSAMAGGIAILAAAMLIQGGNHNPREVLERGIAKLIRLLVPVIAGAAKLAEQAGTIWAKVEAHAEKQGGWGAVAGKAADKVWADFANGLNTAWAELSRMPPNFGNIVKALGAFADVVPVIVVALGFTEAEANELVSTVKAVVKVGTDVAADVNVAIADGKKAPRVGAPGPRGRYTPPGKSGTGTPKLPGPGPGGGALVGAGAGFLVGGPIGAVIGAVAGALLPSGQVSLPKAAR